MSHPRGAASAQVEELHVLDLLGLHVRSHGFDTSLCTCGDPHPCALRRHLEQRLEQLREPPAPPLPAGEWVMIEPQWSQAARSRNFPQLTQLPKFLVRIDGVWHGVPAREARQWTDEDLMADLASYGLCSLPLVKTFTAPLVLTADDLARIDAAVVRGGWRGSDSADCALRDRISGAAS